MSESTMLDKATGITADDAEEYSQSLGQIGSGWWRQVAWGERQGVPHILGLSTRDWVIKYTGAWLRLPPAERREAVLELEGEGLSNVKIADILGVDEGTVRYDKKAMSENSESQDSEQIAVSGDGSENSEPQPGPGDEPPPEPETPPLPEGRYRCIVIDPPWPIEKIERKVRSKQGRFPDYHVWSIQRIRDDVDGYLKAKADSSGCHVYLWATHRHLPEAFKLFGTWGIRYQCLMTWKKNVGITPYSWMYDTEHVLFGRIGGLALSQNGLRLWFDAAVTRHSEKPDVFYDRVRAASPEPRLDLFAREHREGFTVWGNEVIDVTSE